VNDFSARGLSPREAPPSESGSKRRSRHANEHGVVGSLWLSFAESTAIAHVVPSGRDRHVS